MGLAAKKHQGGRLSLEGVGVPTVDASPEPAASEAGGVLPTVPLRDVVRADRSRRLQTVFSALGLRGGVDCLTTAVRVREPSLATALLVLPSEDHSDEERLRYLLDTRFTRRQVGRILDHAVRLCLLACVESTADDIPEPYSLSAVLD